MSAMALRFCPLRPEDLAWVLPIERQSHPMPWSADHFPTSGKEEGQQAVTLWHDATPIGYWVGLFVLDEAHLLNLTVALSWRQQGYGRQLLSHFLDESRRRACRSAWLEVRSDNAPAIALYQALGFQTQAIRRRYYRDAAGRYADALVMSLTIVPTDVAP